VVETAGKTAKKNYNKIGTEDDPVIVAQRFLNIFRQLHIFSAERKDAFNKMILEQPAEVRGMFNSLPGGAVLQQYVDELEEQSGISRNMAYTAPQIGNGDTQPQILSAALAGADAQKSALSEQDKADAARLAAQAAAEAAAKATAAAQAQIAAQTAQLQQAMAQMQQSSAAVSTAQSGQSVNQTITADASFAKEIASALKEAVSASDENRRKDSEALTKNLLDSQKKLAEIMLMSSQIHQQSQTASNMNSGDTISAPQTKTVFQPVSSTLTADASFAKEIASALKEAITATDDSRKKESQELTKAIVDSQNKLAEIMVQSNSATLEAQNRLAQMLVQNNTANNATSSNNNANNIQINTAATFPPIEDMVSGIVKVQSELFREMAKTQTSELSSIITLALKESQQLSTQSIIAAIREMQKENLKMLQTRPVVYTQPPLQTAAEQTEHPVRMQTDDAVTTQSNFLSETDDILGGNETFSFENSDNDDTSGILAPFADETAPKKKKKKKKKKKNSESLSLDGLASSLMNKVSTLTDKVSNLSGKKIIADITGREPTDDLPLPTMSEEKLPAQELPLTDTTEISALNDLSFEETKTEKPQTAAEDDSSWEYVEAPIEEAAVETEEPQTAAEDDSSWEYVEAPVEEATVEAEEPQTAAEDDSFWEYVEAPIEEAAAEAEEPQTAAEDDSSWEYVEAPVEEAATEAEEPQTAAEDDSSWEYVEAPIEEAAVEAEEPQTAAEDDSWEYVEAPIEEAAVEAEEPQTAAEQEWEWDYEEVSEDDVSANAGETSDNLSADTEEDGWEYVEIPEEDAAAEEDGWEYVEIPEDEADGEEEWEYVEVPEDETKDNTAPMVLNSQDGSEDWEWDYEEVPENETTDATSESTGDTGLMTEEDPDISATSDNFGAGLADPYRPEAEQADTNENETTSLSSMYSGEVYFQDNVYTKQNEDNEQFNLPDGLSDGSAFHEQEDRDSANDPYKPQGTI